MKIEILYFDGCHNHERIVEQLPALLDRAGITSRPILREITAQDAEREQFLGSPTLRIDGRDVEPGAADRTDYGLKCRIYHTSEGLTGLPADDWILAALNAG
jgi:hypothetical protein